jgi:hypothetical protein
MNDPKTSRLIGLTGTNSVVRLLAADRAFLKDLAKVQIVSGDLATKHHYSHLKGGSLGSLERLEKAGLITSRMLYTPNSAPVKTYQFANKSIASAYGGKLPTIGAKRSDLHELMTSRAYFELGRPESFKVASDFSKSEIAACGSLRPDAIFVDGENGEMVIVEADSGHYNQKQVNEKINRWRNAGLNRQVWARPAGINCARVPAFSGIQVMSL